MVAGDEDNPVAGLTFQQDIPDLLQWKYRRQVPVTLRL